MEHFPAGLEVGKKTNLKSSLAVVDASEKIQLSLLVRISFGVIGTQPYHVNPRPLLILVQRDLKSETLGYHPNIITGDVQDHQTLLDYVIAHGRLRERVARKFARQIGSALAYCHRHNIIHRDITVDNVLISPTGDAKITNFKFATTYSPFGLLYTFCGSSYFPAPEMCAQQPYVGPEVDVWGLGVVLYILVCGRVPFDAHDMKTIHAKVMHGSVEYPFHLSASALQIMSVCLLLMGFMENVKIFCPECLHPILRGEVRYPRFFHTLGWSADFLAPLRSPFWDYQR